VSLWRRFRPEESEHVERGDTRGFRTGEGGIGRVAVVDIPQDEFGPVVAFDALVRDDPR
jgi:hypothetical protein